MDKLLQALLDTVDLAGLLNWERLAADVFFPEGREAPRKLNTDSREKELLPIYW